MPTAGSDHRKGSQDTVQLSAPFAATNRFESVPAQISLIESEFEADHRQPCLLTLSCGFLQYSSFMTHKRGRVESLASVCQSQLEHNFG